MDVTVDIIELRFIPETGGRELYAVIRIAPPGAEELDASFDPSSASSPPAAICREVARPLAEALRGLMGGG